MSNGPHHSKWFCSDCASSPAGLRTAPCPDCCGFTLEHRAELRKKHLGTDNRA